MADERWKRLAEQQGVLTLKPSRLNLKLDAEIPPPARNCAGQFSILWPREKCESKRVWLKSFSFSFWKQFAAAILGPVFFPRLLQNPRPWIRCPRLIPRARGPVLQPLVLPPRRKPA